MWWETPFFLLVALVGSALPVKKSDICAIVSYVLLICHIDLGLKNKDIRTHELLLYFQVIWLHVCTHTRLYMCVLSVCVSPNLCVSVHV